MHISANANGAAEIQTASGGKITIPKERGQTGITDTQVAQDGMSAGWLVEYKVGDFNSFFPGTLIVWRQSKPLRRFQTDQSFWSWAFLAEGKQVAYHTGPLHGEQKSHCELRDVETGSLVASWDGDLDEATSRPAWTRGLDH